MRLRHFSILVWCLLVVFWADAGICELRRNSRPLLFGFALEGYPIDEHRIRSVLCETGISPNIVLFYLQWKYPNERDPLLRGSLEAIWSMGAVPCITWEPMHIEGGKEVMIDFRNITNGGYDNYIQDIASTIRAFQQPVLMRFAHEMNLKRYHWGTDEAAYGKNSPAIYRNLFRYVVTVFRKENVTNVRWVFCPNAESIPNQEMDPEITWNDIASYYPGNEWVDVLGVDGYNWGTTQKVEQNGWQSSWRSFENIFRKPVQALRNLSAEKPLVLFETASAGSGGDKGQWIREAFETAQLWGIQGIIWFQVNKEIDWRLHVGIDPQEMALIRSIVSPAHRWILTLPGNDTGWVGRGNTPKQPR